MAITSQSTAQQKPALASGEPQDALEAAFDAHWEWVCRTLYKLVGSWDEAQDLALEVFCRLHRQPPRDWEKLRAWLHRVATNVGLNALRARNRRRRYEEQAEQYRLEQTNPRDPVAETEQQESRLKVHHVLAQMKPRAAQMLILRHSGLSYREIARAVHVAPGSVGTLLARAEKDFERRYRALEGQYETPW
jgi:RNA polymerase sigma-70 factor (ECF subfamily)